jgi:hypothetical protein
MKCGIVFWSRDFDHRRQRDADCLCGTLEASALFGLEDRA